VRQQPRLKASRLLFPMAAATVAELGAQPDRRTLRRVLEATREEPSIALHNVSSVPALLTHKPQYRAETPATHSRMHRPKVTPRDRETGVSLGELGDRLMGGLEVGCDRDDPFTGGAAANDLVFHLLGDLLGRSNSSMVLPRAQRLPRTAWLAPIPGLVCALAPVEQVPSRGPGRLTVSEWPMGRRLPCAATGPQ
jgi:hypothetical protein